MAIALELAGTSVLAGGVVGAAHGTAGTVFLEGGESWVNSRDPLSLLFLAQFIAVTAKLSTMSKSYQAFAKSFAVFNLQITAPSWARTALSGRRLANNKQRKWFDDENEASIAMVRNFSFKPTHSSSTQV